MIHKAYLTRIRRLVQSQEREKLTKLMNRRLPPDLAAILVELTTDEQSVLVSVLDPPLNTQAFEYLTIEQQGALLQILPDELSRQIINCMAPDDRTALLEELPKDYSERLLSLLSPSERAIAEALLQYDPETVGRLMTPDFLAIRKDWTIKHVLDFVRSHGKDSETLSYLYVIDDDHRLIDDVRIREFLLAPLHHHVRDVMDNQFVSLKATDSRRTAVSTFRTHDRNALPVVDARGVLAGIVTIDDVLDIAEREATKELQRFGGLEALDEPYIATPLLSMVRKRASWLVILFVGEMLTATAMGFFEHEIAKAVVLALFVPLVISSGGNSGSQAATLIIRALALGEVKLHDWFKVLKRELISGVLLGAILGTIGFVRIALWSAFSDLYGPHWLLIAFTVSFSLVGIVLWGTISGSMLPLVLKKAGFDPATSSAPFVATMVDVTGLIIYFSVAFIILRGTLL